MGRSRYRINDPKTAHFLTCTIVNWLPIFTRRAAVDIVLDSLRYLQAERDMRLYGYVILENHLHLIAASDDLARDIAHFKSYTAKQLIICLTEHRAHTLLRQLAFFKRRHKRDRTYQVWQEGSHPQKIQGWDMLRQKIGIHSQQPGGTRVRGPARALAVLECAQLYGRGGAD